MEKKDINYLKELYKQCKINVIKIPESSKFHVPGMIEDMQRRYGYFEVQDGKIVLVKKK